jgi:hypothetical protein
MAAIGSPTHRPLVAPAAIPLLRRRVAPRPSRLRALIAWLFAPLEPSPRMRRLNAHRQSGSIPSR